MIKTEAAKKQPQAYSLRISPELRNECQAIADRKGMSLNEWMKRALTAAVVQETDTDLEETVNELKAFLELKNHGLEHPSWTEYLTRLIQDETDGSLCISCGTHNPKSNRFCKECGEILVWEDSLKKFADAYYDDFVSNHPMKDVWDFVLTGPDKENQNAPYIIWGFPKNSRRAPKIAKALKQEDFRKGEELLEARRNKK